MTDKVLKTIEDCQMLSRCRVLGIGLSGGADSVMLLTCLADSAEQLGITLEAAHFNHQLRGGESDEDEAFVKELCDK